jgi:hypothetical protein
MRLDISLSTMKEKNLKEKILNKLEKALGGNTYIEDKDDYEIISVVGDLGVIRKTVRVLEDLEYD